MAKNLLRDGYTATKIKSRWDPTVPVNDRIPRTISAGPKIAESNRVNGAVDHIASELYQGSSPQPSDVNQAPDHKSLVKQRTKASMKIQRAEGRNGSYC